MGCMEFTTDFIRKSNILYYYLYNVCYICIAPSTHTQLAVKLLPVHHCLDSPGSGGQGVRRKPQKGQPGREEESRERLVSQRPSGKVFQGGRLIIWDKRL